MVLYESNSAKVEWLESEKVVLKVFKGYIFGEDLKSAFDAGYQQLKKIRR